MFSDDRFMTLATGLVLAIVVGTLAQKSDSVMAFFGSSDVETAEADQFTVRAGKNQILDVQANDTIEGAIVITQAPSCGSVRAGAGGSVEYYDSAACTGNVSFAYCIEKGDVCEATTVGLSLVNPEAVVVAKVEEAEPVRNPEDEDEFYSAVGDGPDDGAAAPAAVVAVAQGDRLVPGQILLQDDPDSAVVGFGVATAPTLFAPDMAELIQPQETVDTLRRSVAAVAPSRIDQDQNIARQTSAGSPSRVNLSNGAQQQTPVGTEASPTVAFLAPSQPRLMAAPVLAPVQNDKPVVRGPAVDSSAPGNFATADIKTDDDPVSISETMDMLAAIAIADAPYGQEPSGPPENVDTQTASAGDVRVAADDPSDSSDIVVEMAAQIVLPAPQLVQTLDREEQVTPEAAALLSDQNFVANLEPSAPPVKEEPKVASLPFATAQVPVVAPEPAVAACDVKLDASARPGAEISLLVVAKCHARETVKIEHAGLAFTTRLDAQGIISAAIPALEIIADITVTFEDGTSGQTQLRVRDAKSIERVVVMWSEPVSLDLHAFENGAAGNAVGHVWTGNPRKYRDTLIGGGGYLTILGDPGITGGGMAEVYSLPTNRLRKQTTVQMDLNITDASQACGQTMLLQTIRTQKGSDPQLRSFNLALPACSAAVSSLVLENFVDAISVARR